MRRTKTIFGAAFLLCSVGRLLPAAEVTSPTSQAARLSTAAVSSTKEAAHGAEQVAYINDLIHQGWQAQGLQPSQVATDGEWCRRVYLDVLGRIPSVDELEHYLSDHTPQKKQNLIDRLLSDEYVEDYSHNWSNIWTTILLGRPPAMRDQRSLVDRDGMEKYLRDSFARNKPYDQMVTELITAAGANKPGEEDFHGEVNFLIGNLDDNARECHGQDRQSVSRPTGAMHAMP